MKNFFKSINWKFFVLIVVAWLVMWPLIGFVDAKITHNVFEYSISKHIVTPIVAAIVFILIETILKYKKNS